jgi:hypothetical protein
VPAVAGLYHRGCARGHVVHLPRAFLLHTHSTAYARRSLREGSWETLIHRNTQS